MAGATRVYPGVEEALRAAQSSGVLIGVEGGDGISIIGAVPTTAETGQLQDVLPLPLAVAGTFVPAGQTSDRSEGLLRVAVSEAGDLAWEWRAGGAGGAAPAPVQPAAVGGAWHEGWVVLRVRAAASVTFIPGDAQRITDAVGELCAKIAGEDTLYLTEGDGVNLAEVGDWSELGTGSWDSPVLLRPFAALTSAQPATRPQVIEAPGPAAGEPATVRLALDVLCYVARPASGAAAVAYTVRPAVQEQLARLSLLLAPESQLPASIHAYHFLPPGMAHHVTMLYPSATASVDRGAEAALEPTRRAAHDMLGLDPRRPLLRVSHALAWQGREPASGAELPDGKLRDVHVGIPASKVKGGTQHLVKGSYVYHHYMQDKTNDKGWGCAYRSLQTLWSWLQGAGYVAGPPPGHELIQATLVKLGDKPASFRGSKQWIGALELSFVLEELLGVESKVMPLASGADLPAQARALAHHFDTQGTPVMVGGGVLAYTLLGVDWNEDTGAVAFLILDPHYTGPEDLKKIQAGQWVAWKQHGDAAAAGGKLLHDDAFYNLLCPQLPRGV